MEYANYVILGGRPYATKEERPIVERLTMPHPKFYKELNMICQLIFGVLVSWRMRYLLVKPLFITLVANKR